MFFHSKPSNPLMGCRFLQKGEIRLHGDLYWEPISGQWHPVSWHFGRAVEIGCFCRPLEKDEPQKIIGFASDGL